jgi:hypothetical protein
MRKFVLGLASCLALAGCDDAALFLPMTPTRASIAAPRRQLTNDEKDAISDAVLRKLGDQSHRDFTWFPLVVRPQDGVVDYCGQVSGDDVVGEYNIRDAKAEFRDYYAQLTFDRGGKLAKVDVVALGEKKSRSIPTQVDSTCLQDGYNVRR